MGDFVRLTADELAELIRVSAESGELITGLLGGWINVRESGPMTLIRLAEMRGITVPEIEENDRT